MKKIYSAHFVYFASIHSQRCHRGHESASNQGKFKSKYFLFNLVLIPFSLYTVIQSSSQILDLISAGVDWYLEADISPVYCTADFHRALLGSQDQTPIAAKSFRTKQILSIEWLELDSLSFVVPLLLPQMSYRGFRSGSSSSIPPRILLYYTNHHISYILLHYIYHPYLCFFFFLPPWQLYIVPS